MKKLLIALFFVLTFLCGFVNAATYTAGGTGCSGNTCCTFTNVQAAVASASRGDTVLIPTGDCTWTSRLDITKGINLIGAGKSNTFIRNGQSKCSTTSCVGGSCNTFILSYTPSDPTADLSYPIRISGITFDMNYQALGVRLENRTVAFPLTNIRVDNNNFIDAWDCDEAISDPLSAALSVHGRFEGVVDNNGFYGWPYILNDSPKSGTGSGADNFNYSAFEVHLGTSHFVFYEDNYIESSGPVTYTGYEPFLITQDNGAKTIVRFNEFYANRNVGWASGFAKPFSPHHPNAGIDAGGKGGEFYGNLLRQVADKSWQWGTPRAGKNLAFYNRIYATTNSIKWSYYPPTSYRPVTTNYQCSTNTDIPVAFRGLYWCDTSGQPQTLYESYQWNNMGGLYGAGSPTGATKDSSVRLNIDAYNYTTSFDGTAGVGCGTAATMNAIGTCTDGVGFWVPNALLDPTAASCTNVNDWVGRNNAKAISVNGDIGRLYKCLSNAWVQYYQPYTYPHPLRGGTDTTAGQLSLPTACSGADCTTPLACTGDDEEVAIGVTATDNIGITGVKCCLENGSTCVPATTYANMNITLSLQSGTAENGVWGTTVTNACNDPIAYNCKGTDLAGNITPNIINSYDMETGSDITDPTLSTQSLGVLGRTLTLVFSEPVRKGAEYLDSQWTFTVGGTPVDIECPLTAGWDTDTLVCQVSECVADDAVLTLDYTQPGEGLGIVDQSDNTFTIGDAASVTNNSEQTCGASGSLFDHADTPTYTEWPWDPSTFGVRFKSSVAGAIEQICFYKDIEMAETHSGGVWDDSGTLLGSLTFTDEAESGWICQALETSVNILANTYYTVGVHSPREKVHTNNFFASSYTSSDGKLFVDVGGGKYNDSSSLAFPSTPSGYNRNWWVDFVMSFADEGGPWQMTISNVSAAGYKCNVSGSDIIDDGNSGEVEVTTANGWKATFSGCGSGSVVQVGNVYTYTTAAITANCTVEVTCSQKHSPGWGVP